MAGIVSCIPEQGHQFIRKNVRLGGILRLRNRQRSPEGILDRFPQRRHHLIGIAVSRWTIGVSRDGRARQEARPHKARNKTALVVGHVITVTGNRIADETGTQVLHRRTARNDVQELTGRQDLGLHG